MQSQSGYQQSVIIPRDSAGEAGLRGLTIFLTLSVGCYLLAVRRLLSTTSILVKRMVDRYLKVKPTVPIWFVQAAGSLSPPHPPHHHPGLGGWAGVRTVCTLIRGPAAPTPPPPRARGAGLGAVVAVEILDSTDPSVVISNRRFRSIVISNRRFRSVVISNRRIGF